MIGAVTLGMRDATRHLSPYGPTPCTLSSQLGKRAMWQGMKPAHAENSPRGLVGAYGVRFLWVCADKCGSARPRVFNDSLLRLQESRVVSQ